MNKKQKLENNLNTDPIEGGEKNKVKRVDSSGHRGSFYNSYLHWRSEFRSSGLTCAGKDSDDELSDDEETTVDLGICILKNLIY